jgi:hypothetical protein
LTFKRQGEGKRRRRRTKRKRIIIIAHVVTFEE